MTPRSGGFSARGRGLLGLASVVVACQLGGGFAAAAPVVTRDVRYRDLLGVAAAAHVLDIHAAERAANDPVLVYVHGGGWRNGDKADVGRKPEFFTGRGWLFVSVNYRLLPEGRHPANVEDVAAALAWVRDHIAEYGGDPRRIVVMGHSAGAHLAALVATDPRPLESAGASLQILAGAIPVDTLAYRIRDPDGEGAPEGHALIFGPDPAVRRDASPQEHVARDRGIPPFLIVYTRGSENTDASARRSTAESFAATLRDAGVPADVVDASDRTHREVNDRLGDPADDRVTGRIAAFLDGLLRPGDDVRPGGDPPAGTGAAPPGEAAATERRRHTVRWAVDRPSDPGPAVLAGVPTICLVHATPETGTFHLHPHLASFAGGVFACWDSQARDENAPGQHGVYRFTTDGGRTWSPATPLFPPLAANVPRAEAAGRQPFQTSQGFVSIDGRLYAVTCVDRTLPRKVVRFNEVSRERVGLLAREVDANGSLGPIFWLAATAPAAEPGFAAFPAGAPDVVARIVEHFERPAHLPQLRFGPDEHPDSDDHHRMTEPTQPWRLADGTWVRLYRDQGDAAAESRWAIEASRLRRFYAAFSHDDGATWTTPTPTDVPDSGARAATGLLPDGQVYLVHNPLPLPAARGGRATLAISLSADGLTFDRSAVLRDTPPPRRHEGRAKAVGYQYPHAAVVGDDLWVIYAVNKEDIELARVPLRLLADMRGGTDRSRPAP